MQLAQFEALEIITRQPPDACSAVPILFVHGGCFGAWCWEENYLDYFAAHGFSCTAVSLSGHGGSVSGRPLRMIRLSEYVDDVCAVIDAMPVPPVLVGHSIGGTTVQLVSRLRPLSGMVLLASNPPTGTWRIARRAVSLHPWLTTVAALTGRQLRLFGSPDLAQRWFFAPGTPRPMVERFAARLQEESSVAVAQTLWPISRSGIQRTTPTLVLAGEHDAMVTTEMALATARRYGATIRIVPDVAHCMMLDTAWRNSADALVDWLRDSLGCVRAGRAPTGRG